MRKILYILRREDHLSTRLLADKVSSEESPSVLLIQDGVRLDGLPVDQVYVLAEDAESRKVTSRYPTVSYQEMVKLIFDADAVVAF